MMLAALLVAGTVVVFYVILALVLWRFQERIVFQPPSPLQGEASKGVQELTYVAADGVQLFALVVGSYEAGAPVVLAFHGNAVVARWLVPWAHEVVHRIGGCVVLAEYRGYDGIGGTPTYEGAGLDAKAALQATCTRFAIDESRLVLFGHSLGSAVAAELADASRPKSLVLQSPFSSARDMVSRWPVVGFRTGWSLISRVHYDTVGRVRALDTPVYVAHGEQDRVVPVRMGREVFAAARRPGRLLSLAAAGHNDVPEAGGEAYWSWLAEALDPNRQ